MNTAVFDCGLAAVRRDWPVTGVAFSREHWSDPMDDHVHSMRRVPVPLVYNNMSTHVVLQLDVVNPGHPAVHPSAVQESDSQIEETGPGKWASETRGNGDRACAMRAHLADRAHEAWHQVPLLGVPFEPLASCSNASLASLP